MRRKRAVARNTLWKKHYATRKVTDNSQPQVIQPEPTNTKVESVRNALIPLRSRPVPRLFLISTKPPIYARWATRLKPNSSRPTTPHARKTTPKTACPSFSKNRWEHHSRAEPEAQRLRFGWVGIPSPPPMLWCSYRRPCVRVRVRTSRRLKIRPHAPVALPSLVAVSGVRKGLKGRLDTARAMPSRDGYERAGTVRRL